MFGFWIGVIIGTFSGTIVGVTVVAMCRSASIFDDHERRITLEHRADLEAELQQILKEYGS